ncbi:hypothetical protein BDV95DRAFT_171873 [Massariosphaeria phaeospora]|uniref:Uncharacterized protein n=1 Tax=Massariosphaeria phaeospora TaxID=100035 RepID=A0A7C8I0R3_9PLEO|nr:hypothetical protein BDV95DRAFT_171873 [Massariosphaeria phaeospora]
MIVDMRFFKVTQTVTALAMLAVTFLKLSNIFLAFDIALVETHGTLQASLVDAMGQYNTTMACFNTENAIYVKAERLFATKLRKSYAEEHDACLVRGMNFADLQFWGSPYYRLPDVRNATIKWAEKNCARLFFTPAVHRPPRRLLTLTRWQGVHYEAERVLRQAGKAINAVKQGASDSAIWVRDWVKRKYRPETLSDRTSKLEIQAHKPRPVIRPRHFELDCGGLVCHLRYNPPADMPHNVTRSTDEDLLTARVKVSALRTYAKKLEFLRGVNLAIFSIFWISHLMAIVGVVCGVYYWNSAQQAASHRPRPAFCQKVWPFGLYPVNTIATPVQTANLFLLCVLHVGLHWLSASGCTTRQAAMAFCFAVFELVRFFVPDGSRFNAYGGGLVGAIKILHAVAKQPWIRQEQTANPLESARSKTEFNPTRVGKTNPLPPSAKLDIDTTPIEDVDLEDVDLDSDTDWTMVNDS